MKGSNVVAIIKQKLTDTACLIGVLVVMCSCSNEQSHNEVENGGWMERMTNDTQLSFSSSGPPQNFFLRNPEYNPSWIAELKLTEKEASALKLEVKKKELLNMRRSSSPSDWVSWWAPRENSEKFTYMTSKNAPVTVIFSQNEEQFDVFIWWSSP